MDEIVEVLRKVLPGARPPPRDGHEAVSLAVHAIVTARLGVPPDVTDGWSGEDDDNDVIELTPGGGLVLKLLKMGPVLMVHAGVGDDPDKVESIEIMVADYINKGAPLDDPDRIFSLGLSKLVTTVDVLLRKVGVTKTQSGAAAATSAEATQAGAAAAAAPRRRRDPDPLRADPLRVGPIRGGPGYRPVPARPWNPVGDLGRGDLDPLGRGGGMLLDPRGMGVPPGVRPPLGPGQIPRARFDPIFPGGRHGPRPPGGGFPSGPTPDHMPIPPDSDDLFGGPRYPGGMPLPPGSGDYDMFG